MISERFHFINTGKNHYYIYNKYYIFKLLIAISLFNLIFYYLVIMTFFENKTNKIINFLSQNNIKPNILALLKLSNIDTNDDFFQIKQVQQQIYNNNLTYINSISGGNGFIGNALIMLNKLINICENIRCQNIIAPASLNCIIKKPIFYKDYNITIYPESHKNQIKIDIKLSTYNNFYFNYRKKPIHMRLRIIRNEVLQNIPKYNAGKNDLYINIRSGDVFVTVINPNYAQPPLCFYQKIINENIFEKIFIMSNGHENPVVDELLKLYPKIKYIHGTLVEDIAVVIYSYNFVMPISTFPITLINLNFNLLNIYLYELINYQLTNVNYKIHTMKPSFSYDNIMKGKWKNTKEQLNLMLNESCINSTMITYFPKN